MKQMFINKCLTVQANQLVKFTDHNITNKVVTIQPMYYEPYLFHAMVNGTNLLNICGPLFNIVKEFAKISNSYLILKAEPESVERMVGDLMEGELDILLTPAKTSNYLEYSTQLSEVGIPLNHSDCIDFFEVLLFVYKINYRPQPLFQFLRAFDMNVWYFIFLSIITLAIVSSKILGSSRKVFDHSWYYFTLLFSKTIQNSFLNSKTKLFLGIWLMTGYYLTIGFTSFILEHMVKAPPIIFIDNLEQLSHLKDVKIVSNSESTLAAIANSQDNELSMNITAILDSYIYDQWENFSRNLGAQLRNGSRAYNDYRMSLIYTMDQLMKYENVGKNEPKLTDLLHISEESGGLEPYFLFINGLSEQWVSDGINYIIISMRESGIYTKWCLDVLEYHRDQIGTFDKKQDVVLFEFSELQVSNILDILYITCLGIFSSIITVIIEIFLSKI